MAKDFLFDKIYLTEICILKDGPSKNSWRLGICILKADFGFTKQIIL